MAVFRVAALSELPTEAARVVEAGPRTLALVRTGGALFAMDNACPHAGGPLGEGTLENGLLRCPWHDRHFDPRTGQCVNHARTRAVVCHPVRVNGDEVAAELPD